MKHYNPSIIEYINRLLNPKGTFGDIELQEYIQPVLNVNDGRISNIIRRSTLTNVASTTIYTTPSDKDFYLTSVNVSVTKDVTSTSTASRITVIIEGISRQICCIAGISLTIQNQSLSMSFPIPIKVDRNTAISLENTTNVANIQTDGSIIGYTVEMTKGT